MRSPAPQAPTAPPKSGAPPGLPGVHPRPKGGESSMKFRAIYAAMFAMAVLSIGSGLVEKLMPWHSPRW